MESLIATTLALKYQPVAILFTNEKPARAKQFADGKFGCVMAMLASAARGNQAVFDRRTSGCPGGGTGLGFGNQYLNFPGGLDCFYYFISTGNEQWEQGKQTIAMIKPFVSEDLYDDLAHGERYTKTPELVEKFIEILPITDIPFEYVVFKPLKDIDLSQETPEVIVFLVDADQLSALIVLANYDRSSNESVIIPQCAGCQSIGIYPYSEAQSDTPRAVLGLADISARVQIKRQL